MVRFCLPGSALFLDYVEPPDHVAAWSGIFYLAPNHLPMFETPTKAHRTNYCCNWMQITCHNATPPLIISGL